MKWLFIAVIIFAQQPTKAPERKRALEGIVARDAHQNRASNDDKTITNPPQTIYIQQISSPHPKRDTDSANEGATQRWIEIFTGCLVAVGALQSIVMLMQWCIYRRQTREMRRQRHEIRQQRHIMWRQWKAMGIQAAHMEGQLTEMQESRKIQNKTLILQYRPKIVVRYARALEFNFRFGDMGEGRIKLRIVNTGGSSATITGGFFALWSSIGNEIGKIELLKGEDMVLGEFTLEPGQSDTIECLLLTGTENDVQWANFHAGLRSDPLLFMRLVGEIRYVDELGIPRATGVNRTYEPKTKWFSPSGEEGEYTD
jgi:hypothetical protein